MSFANSNSAESQPAVQINLHRGKRLKETFWTVCLLAVLIASPPFCLSTTTQFLRCLRERDVSEFKAQFREGSSGMRFARLKEAQDLAGSVPVPSVGEVGEAPCQRHLQGARTVGMLALRNVEKT